MPAPELVTGWDQRSSFLRAAAKFRSRLIRQHIDLEAHLLVRMGTLRCSRTAMPELLDGLILRCEALLVDEDGEPITSEAAASDEHEVARDRADKECSVVWEEDVHLPVPRSCPSSVNAKSASQSARTR